MKRTNMPHTPHEASARAVRNNRPVQAQYVRQGRRGARIMAVLVGGLLLTAVGFALVWAFWAGPFAAAPVDNGAQVEDAAAFQDEATTTSMDATGRSDDRGTSDGAPGVDAAPSSR